MRSSLALALASVFLCLGCFQFTEDSQGNLQSVGMPGTTIWKSAAASKPVTPEQLGYSPEEAAKLGGPVLVQPADSSSHNWRYRFYYANNNQCAATLARRSRSARS